MVIVIIDHRKRTVRQYILFHAAVQGCLKLEDCTVIFHTLYDGEHFSVMTAPEFIKHYGKRLMGSYLADDFLLEDGFRCTKNFIISVIVNRR